MGALVVPIGTGDDAETPLGVSAIIATSGSTVSADTTANTGNAIAVPSTHSELMVYVGDLGIATEKAVLYVKVGAAAVQAVEVFSWSCIAIKAVTSTTVAFGAATLARNSNTLTNGTLPLNVIPHKGQAQVAPTATTGTVNLDRCPPNLYSPARPCVSLAGEYQTIQIASATRKRDIFIQEYDGSANLLPIRHVHLPENQTVNVACRYSLLFMFSIDTPTLTITAPAGAVFAKDAGVVWEPDFTPSQTITVSTVAAFQNAMNTNADNVEVVLTPGVYDLSASGTRFSGGNYTTAMFYNRRIRSSTGIASDVLFKVATPTAVGSQWAVALSGTNNYWVLKDMSWDITNCIKTGAETGMLNFYGPVHMVRCIVSGAYDSSSVNTSVKWLANSTTGSCTIYAAWCKFSGASLDLTAANGDGTKTYIPTLHQIGNYLDGNGPNSSDQVITNHNKGIVIAWGCSFGNLSNGNRTRIASELEEAPNYNMFCRSYPENYVTLIGVDVPGSGTANPNFLHFCDFQAAGIFDAIKSAVCSTMKTYTTGRPLAYVASSIATPKYTGCDIMGSTAGADFILDCLSTSVSIFGCRITHQGSVQSSGMIRMYNSSGTTPWTGTIKQSLLRVTQSATPFWLLANDYTLLALQNVIHTGATGTYNISATNGTDTAAGCYLHKATSVGTAPSNWDARFSGTTWASLGTNVKSANAPNLTALDVANDLGDANDVDGIGTTAVVGSTDIYGRPWLGGAWDAGCAERTAIRSNGFLFPLVWI